MTTDVNATATNQGAIETIRNAVPDLYGIASLIRIIKENENFSTGGSSDLFNALGVVADALETRSATIQTALDYLDCPNLKEHFPPVN